MIRSEAPVQNSLSVYVGQGLQDACHHINISINHSTGVLTVNEKLWKWADHFMQQQQNALQAHMHCKQLAGNRH